MRDLAPPRTVLALVGDGWYVTNAYSKTDEYKRKRAIQVIMHNGGGGALRVSTPCTMNGEMQLEFVALHKDVLATIKRPCKKAKKLHRVMWDL